LGPPVNSEVGVAGGVERASIGYHSNTALRGEKTCLGFG
jgi:hypothetical protein